MKRSRVPLVTGLAPEDPRMLTRKSYCCHSQLHTSSKRYSAPQITKTNYWTHRALSKAPSIAKLSEQALCTASTKYHDRTCQTTMPDRYPYASRSAAQVFDRVRFDWSDAAWVCETKPLYSAYKLHCLKRSWSRALSCATRSTTRRH